MNNFFIISKRTRSKMLVASAIALFAMVFFYDVSLSDADGKSGRTVSGCTCHGSSASTATSVSVSSSSGSFTVSMGSTNTFTVLVANSSYSKFGVGIGAKTNVDATVNAGILASVNSDLRISGGELVQNAQKSGMGQASFQFTWTAPTTPGTYYFTAVGLGSNNADNTTGDSWNTMIPIPVTVSATQTITLTSPNGGESFCSGTEMPISWTAAGGTTVNVSLSSNSGANWTVVASNVDVDASPINWDIPSNTVPGNKYRLKIASSYAEDISEADFSIFANTTIINQPESISVCNGSPAIIQIEATGSKLNYNWKKNGADVPNGYSSTLSIPITTKSDAGNYTCTVTGDCGNPVTSSIAILTIDEKPVDLSDTSVAYVCVGNNYSINLNVTGSELTYRWRKNGQMIENATNSILNIVNFQTTDTASYDCLVTGKCPPSVLTKPTKLKVKNAPKITSQSESFVECQGEAFNLFAVADQTNVTCQWFKDGVAIANANNILYNIEAFSATDVGTYRCDVTNECGQVASTANIVITLNKKPEIQTQPSDADAIAGDPLTLYVTAKGTDLKYQWKHNGTEIQGANSSKLMYYALNIDNAGNYVCIVSNDCGAVVSDTAHIKVTQVFPQATLALSIDSLDFGNLKISSSTDSNLVACVKNLGNQELTVTNIQIENSTEFSILSQIPTTPLQFGQSFDLRIGFSPISIGEKNAVVKFTSNSNVEPTLKLRGFGTPNTGINEEKMDSTQKLLVYPNPSKQNVNIRINLENEVSAQLKIYDVNGNTIKEFASKTYPKGIYLELWDGKDQSEAIVPTGKYIVKLMSNDKEIAQTSAMIVR